MNIMNYLGRPWVQGQFDCWALVREIYTTELNIFLPVVPIDARNTRAVIKAFKHDKARGYFEPINTPENMCVVGMSRNNNETITHCGVYFYDSQNQPRIIHNVDGIGVICQKPTEIKTKGLIIQGFYKCQQ